MLAASGIGRADLTNVQALMSRRAFGDVALRELARSDRYRAVRSGSVLMMHKLGFSQVSAGYAVLPLRVSSDSVRRAAPRHSRARDRQRAVDRPPRDAERMVFVTGGAFTSSARAFLDRVPNERLEKPFGPDAVRTLVRRCVDATRRSG